MRQLLEEQNRQNQPKRRRRTTDRKGKNDKSGDYEDEPEYGDYEPRRFANTSGSTTNRKSRYTSKAGEYRDDTPEKSQPYKADSEDNK